MNTTEWKTQHYLLYGRCFTFKMPNWLQKLKISYVIIETKLNAYIFVHHPGINVTLFVTFRFIQAIGGSTSCSSHNINFWCQESFKQRALSCWRHILTRKTQNGVRCMYFTEGRTSCFRILSSALSYFLSSYLTSGLIIQNTTCWIFQMFIRRSQFHKLSHENFVACIFEMFPIGTFKIELFYMSIYHRVDRAL